ncbi:glycosyltransferase family 2 protein [Frigidibacter sp. RF13]|uniref:glycosyltransferase family 2 protein n=1 Tax=Frigidibacter sp. RF13 TaxID=2997340 RepID=UPI00226F8F57|nr:glycosyltransferase family 2 protein [Frigidibacter sp. RF13]MCY1125834.1 glycosyltransferase family 2 protein [Frigidibacter sp. RF13]
MQTKAAPQFHVRRLASGAAGGVAWLDACGTPGADGRQVRIFLRAGQRPALVRDLPESLVIDGTREVSGALMIIGRDTGDEAAPARLGLKNGVMEIPLSSPELDLLAGRNVLFGLRSVETAETVLDWLAYHARHHGATAALIVNRQSDKDVFQQRLAHLLDSADLDTSAPFSVLVVESDIPLGKPDLGPENHPYLAPDAPGKSRMEAPAPDPWSSPLGESLIFEAMKARFLARARAVLLLDPCDILADPDRLPNAFDLCQAAPNGVILLAGRRIYPWRIRKDQPERFGDHICRQFDARRGIARWGVAPEKAGLDKTWRMIRVAYAQPAPGQVVPFWRAMALKVPGQKPSVLAPKTSLVEDPELLRLATACFGAKPVRPKPSEVAAAPIPDPATARTVIVTTMKNEGPFILEWIAYHRAIGVSDFLIYTNDCTDGTDALLDLLQRKGIVQHRDNPFRSMPDHIKPQHAALQAAEDETVVQKADWVICMDVDEFVDIKLGDGRLPTLLAAMGEANMIALTWRMFGNADVEGFEDRFVIAQFPLAAEEMMRKPHQAWGFKTLFRNIDIYRKLGVHRPKGLKSDLWKVVKWLNGSGQPMPREMLRNGWRSSTDSFGYDWVQLNHYACRSVDSYLVKRDRGRVNHVDRDQGVNYWFRMNHNAVEERSIQRMIPALQAEWDRLIADPEIAAQHAACVAAHRAKITELMARPDQQALHAELAGERMRALSRLLRHFGANVFNAGPHVIPEDLHRQKISQDFFFTVDHSGEAHH